MNTTKTVVEAFFNAMYTNNGWEELITDEISFVGPAMPPLNGKEEFIAGTKQFLQNQHTSKVRSIIVDGNNACVLTSYQIGHPDAALLNLDACEIIEVQDGKVNSIEIYLDSQKMATFMAKMQS